MTVLKRFSLPNLGKISDFEIGTKLPNGNNKNSRRFAESKYSVIFLKATKGKSQNRIYQKQQRFWKNDKIKSFLDF